MRITINDEAERRVVLSAIWRHAAAEIGEHFCDRLTDEADAALDPPDDDPPGLLVTTEATLLAATLLDVAAVRDAALGARVGVPMPAEALREALPRCAAARERMIANHDAAVRLLDELHDATDELAAAWGNLTVAVSRQLEGWDDPKSRVIGARERMRLATGAANAALEQALAKAGS